MKKDPRVAKAEAYVQYLKHKTGAALEKEFYSVIGKDMVELFVHFANHIFADQSFQAKEKGLSALLIGYLVKANEVGIAHIPDMRN